MNYRLARLIAALCLVGAFALLGFVPAARGQAIGTGFAVGAPPGVYIDADGAVKTREIDPARDLALMRVRARAAANASKHETLRFVSLPQLFAQARALRAAGKPIPDDLACLGGMTQIRYVLVDPERHDLIIAGPFEPFAPSVDKLFIFGKRSGRPVIQLDDLLTAFRTADAGRGQVFGCALNPSPDSVKKAEQVARDMATASRADRMKALAEAVGPQRVQIFGTEADTRFALVCVAADYELKQFAMGLRRSPVAGMGNAVDNSRSAANKFWFDASYQPLRVSPDGLAYEIRGQRLGVKAGGFDFDPRGATPKALAWARQFDKAIPALVQSAPLFADLQNIADEAVVANLIRHDHLDRKIGWDLSPALDDKLLPIARVPTPRTADTLVSATNGSLAVGGVVLEIGPVVVSREPDAGNSLPPIEKQSTDAAAAGTTKIDAGAR